MKKNILAFSFLLSASLLVSTLVSSAAPIPDKEIPIGASGQMEMVGTVEPTILSVTIPSYVPFNLSNGVAAENKVISPRMKFTNNSNVPVELMIYNTQVDVNKLSQNGIGWSDNGQVYSNEISIGLKQEEKFNQMPENLLNTRWLAANKGLNMRILTLDAKTDEYMYVVGAMGSLVPGSTSFNVTPIFYVSLI